MSALVSQHETWKAAHDRLMNRRPPRDVVVADIYAPRISPFSPLRAPLKKPLPPKPAIYDAGPYYVPKPPEWRDIAKQVADKHDLTVSDLLSVRRARGIVRARHEAWWRCRKETSLSIPQIGQRFGGKDHSSVCHGIAKHQERIDRGEAL